MVQIMTQTLANPQFDPVALAQSLIRCPSVTPHDNGALDALQSALEALGFTCRRLPFCEEGTPSVDNLYARLGTQAPNFCFAGHTDVVPEGDRQRWRHDPYAATIDRGILFGRGAADMKGAIAAFVAAVAAVTDAGRTQLPGSVSLMITGDEEGPGINGTKKILDWLQSENQTIDHCLVGEPSNPESLGDMIKIGRRGSVNMWVTVTGTQGHVAYPHLAKNPVPVLLALLTELNGRKLDGGTEHFQPSNLEITSIDAGNGATNVIPESVTAQLNVRFNTEHTGQALIDWVRSVCDKYESDGISIGLQAHKSGDAFLTEPGPFPRLIRQAVKDVLGTEPEFSTSGGTSDARFIKDFCPVAEFGLIGRTMHKVDECVHTDDIVNLSRIYARILQGYFKL